MSKIKIKICGITRYEDAELSVKLGAWALGFIFWPQSKRSISPQAAHEIIARLSDKELLPDKIVGVFVNPTISELKEAKKIARLTSIQLHGDESPQFCRQVEGEVIKAFRLRDENDLLQLEKYELSTYFLIDAAVHGKYGGTGELCDWNLANKIAEKNRLILSGGLNPKNIMHAWHTVNPFALDLSSGVEEDIGKKSSQLLKELFNTINISKVSYEQNGS